jgi:hypothetical protein
MGIPIYFGQRQRQVPLSPVRRRCESCGQTEQAQVLRDYTYLHVYFIPVRTLWVTHYYDCQSCGGRNQAPPPPGAPPIAFMHRLGWIPLFGVPLVAFLLFVGYVKISDSLRQAERARVNQVEKEAIAAAKLASAEAEAASKSCWAAVQAAVDRGPKVVKVRSTLPADKQALLRAPYVSLVTYGQTMPRPSGKFFAPTPCELEIPEDLKRAASSYGDLGLNEYEQGLAIIASAKALAAKASAVKTPRVIAVGEYHCSKECEGTVMWLDVTDSRVLGALKTTIPMKHLGYDKDGNRVAIALEDAAHAWE